MNEKKINFSISDGDEFFAHEVSLNFNPTQFIFDFKCVTPRSDPRNHEGPTISIKHNVVILDTYHVKKLHELMGNVIAQYEKQFNEITVPKAIEIAEKKKSANIDNKKNKTTVPSYFG